MGAILLPYRYLFSRSSDFNPEVPTEQPLLSRPCLSGPFSVSRVTFPVFPIEPAWSHGLPAHGRKRAELPEMQRHLFQLIFQMRQCIGGVKDVFRARDHLPGRADKGPWFHDSPLSLHVPSVQIWPAGQVESIHLWFCELLCDSREKDPYLNEQGRKCF